MRMVLTNVAAAEYLLELPSAAEGDKDVLAFEDVSGLTGVIALDEERMTLHELAADDLRLRAASWHLPEGAATLGAAATARGFHIDCTIDSTGQAPPFTGNIEADLVDASSITLQLGGQRFSAAVRCERLAIDVGLDNGTAIVGHLEIRELSSSLGGLEVRAARATLRSARVSWGSAGLQLESAAATFSGLSLSFGELELAIDHLAFPLGFIIAGEHFHAGEMHLDKLELLLADLSAFTAPPEAEPEAPPEAEPEAEPEAQPASTAGFELDLRILDQLTGKVDVDATVDATVPVIGRRKATHHFRVPISDGTLNYRELERDLSRLEDAILDIEVRNDKLVLERGVPLLGLHKPIVVWDLDDAELALARKRLVRLRTLPRARLPRSKTSSDERGEDKSKVALRRLEVGNVRVELAMPKEASIPLEGLITGMTLGKLLVAGNLHYDARRALEPTSLSMTAEALQLGLTGLDLGKVKLDVGMLELADVEHAALQFEALTPKRLVASLRGLHARSVGTRDPAAPAPPSQFRPRRDATEDASEPLAAEHGASEA